MIKKIIKVIILIEIFLIPVVANAALWNIDYGPDSKGMADYTDENAKENQEASKKDNVKPSADYVGKSSNNYLKSLYIENAKISPEFNRQYVDYNVTLENSDNKTINIIAEAEDEKATVTGAGKIELKDGENRIQIVVTAENGDVQIYDLYVNMQEQNDEKLDKNTLEQEEKDENLEQEIISTNQNEKINKNNSKKYWTISMILGIVIVVVIIKFIKER